MAFFLKNFRGLQAAVLGKKKYKGFLSLKAPLEQAAQSNKPQKPRGISKIPRIQTAGATLFRTFFSRKGRRMGRREGQNLLPPM